MAPSECQECHRFVYSGASACPYCGCQSPTSQEGRRGKRFIQKRPKLGGGEVPTLLGSWWWIVLCLVVAGLGLLAVLFDWLDWERFFPSGDWK